MVVNEPRIPRYSQQWIPIKGILVEVQFQSPSVFKSFSSHSLRLGFQPLNPPHHLLDITKLVQWSLKCDIPRPSLKWTVSLLSRLLNTVEESVDLRKRTVVESC